MKTLLTLLTISTLTIGISFGQANKYLTAYNHVNEYQQSEFKNTDALLEALEAINETTQNESMQLKGKTWYYKGIINQFIFENEALSGQHPAALFDASNGYQKALTIADKKFRNQEQANKNLFNATVQLYNTGVKFYQLNEYETAAKYFTEVSSIKQFFDANPELEQKVDDTDSRYNAALCLYSIDDKPGATEALKSLIADNYDSESIYQILARYYIEDEKIDEASKVLTDGIKRYPNNLSLRIDELNIYLSQGKEAEAIGKMEETVNMEPENPELHYALGVAYDQTKQFEKSEASYLTVVKLNPEHYNAYNNLGALFYNKGIAINKELSDNMKLSDTQYNKMKADRDALYAKALPYFESAYKIKKDELAIVQALKEIYARTGDYNKAKQMKAEIAIMETPPHLR